MTHRDLTVVVAEAEAADENARFDLLHELREHPELESLDGQDAFRAARLLSVSGDPSDLPAVARLSLQAHQWGGVEGAGLIHAEASDKIALYTGRPQLYGTVMLEHQGDIVQPPVDKRVSDEERAELGVPPLAELQERMATMTRQLAVDRADKPGWLPEGQRYCRVWTHPEPAELRARMEAEGASAWADGDVLTLVAESDLPVTAAPVFPMESWDAGDGLQVLSLRVERLDEAVITYTFNAAGASPQMRFGRGSHDGRFRGANAPAELASNDPLLGSRFEHAVESDALGEPRKVVVYRPPGHTNGDDTPVIYATDGNMFSPYARRLDAAIEQGICPPVVVAAAHSAGFDPIRGNLRAAEYLPGFDNQVYEAHQTFFIDELAEWAEQTIGVPGAPERRGVWGCSDGGGHAAMIARLFPDRFGHAFVYSTGMPPDMEYEWTDAHPFMHLCAGTLEGPFHQATEAWAGYLMLSKARYHFTERVAGHDLVQWAEELPNAIRRAWPS
jgi:enterochelin esterase-like enzyme